MLQVCHIIFNAVVKYLHARAHPVRAMQDNFKWDVVILWKLQGLHGCYGGYVQLFFMKISLGPLHETFTREKLRLF